MEKMKSGDDRRDEVLGARMREAMEDLSPKGEPDFAAIELAAGSRGAMAASSRTARRRPLRALLLIPAAAALALAIGLGWNRLAGARAMAAADGPGLDGTLSGFDYESYRGDPLGTEVALLARESVGGEKSLPAAASVGPDSFHEELSIFVAALWYGAGTEDRGSGDEIAEGSY